MKQTSLCKDRWVLLSLLLSAAIAAVAILPFAFADGGRFVLREDFLDETIPFAMAANRALRLSSGGPYVWGLDLGTPLVHGFGYFCLGSPFFWLSLLFPAEAFPYLTGWILILKYALAGMTAYLFLRCFVHDRRAALAGALLYTFSGYQTVNLYFYMFHDVAAFFPLLLLGMERFVGEKKKGLFVLAVFVSALTNYYMFAAEVIFLLVYFVFRWGSGDVRQTLVLAGRFLVLGVLGVGMAAILFLPNAVYALGNPGHSGGEEIFRLFFDPARFFFVIKGILFAPEVMHDNSAFLIDAWDSTSCYLPMSALALVIAYQIRRRDRLAVLIGVLFAVSLFPMSNAVFTLFTEIVYYRWWCMLILVMTIACARVLEDPGQYPIGVGCIIHAALLFLMLAVAFVLPANEEGRGPIFHPLRLILYSLLILGGIAVWPFVRRMKKYGMAIALTGIVLFSFVTTSYVIRGYRYENDENVFLEQLALGETLGVRDPQYRYRLDRNVLTLTGEAAGVNSYTSTASNAVIRFDRLFDHQKRLWRLDKLSIPGLAELVGARYAVSPEGEVTEIPACPIGFPIERVISAGELQKLPVENRAEALLYAAAVDPADREVASWLSEGTVTQVDAAQVNGVLTGATQEERIAALVAEHTANAVRDFSRDGRGFSFKTEADHTGIYWFSVPADDGWTALIDGERVPHADAEGMLMLRIPAGDHEVRFVYHTPYLFAGAVISLICGVLFLYCITRRSAL